MRHLSLKWKFQRIKNREIEKKKYSKLLDGFALQANLKNKTFLGLFSITVTV